MYKRKQKKRKTKWSFFKTKLFKEMDENEMAPT